MGWKIEVSCGIKGSLRILDVIKKKDRKIKKKLDLIIFND